MKHPEHYPAQIFRGICNGVSRPNLQLSLELDLGFGVTYKVRGKLDNLSLPEYNPVDTSSSESHAAEALLYRVHQLIAEKPVLVIPYLVDADEDTNWPVEYTFNVFYYQPDTHQHWHSLEAQLVRELHAAWQDPTVPVPTIS